MRTNIKRVRFVYRKDRLSDLHDDILIRILSFLDAKSAAQTSVLSKRWNNKFWMHHPDVYLNSKTFGKTSFKFKEFVDTVLTQRDEFHHKIRSFSFTWTFDSMIPQKLLDKIHAQYQNVRHFEFEISCAPHFKYLSQNFSSESLTTLRLNLSNWSQGSLCTDASLNLLRRYLSGCIALKTLWLENFSIKITGGDVDLFSGLEGLKELHIIGCDIIEKNGFFLVRAPKLERLTILQNNFGPELDESVLHREISSGVLKYLRTDLLLSETTMDQLRPYIEEIEIDFPSFTDYRTARHAKWLINKIRCLPQARSVTLSKSILQVISAFPDVFKSRVQLPVVLKWEHLKVITTNELPTTEFPEYLRGLAALTKNCSKTLKVEFV